MLIADMGAGREHLSWAGGTLAHADLLLVVVNPTAKSLTTAVHIDRLARDLAIPDVGVVANRLSVGDADEVEAFCSRRGLDLLASLPEDDRVRRAERDGVCVLDHDPSSPMVEAVGRLTRWAIEEPGRRSCRTDHRVWPMGP